MVPLIAEFEAFCVVLGVRACVVRFGQRLEGVGGVCELVADLEPQLSLFSHCGERFLCLLGELDHPIAGVVEPLLPTLREFAPFVSVFEPISLSNRIGQLFGELLGGRVHLVRRLGECFRQLLHLVLGKLSNPAWERAQLLADPPLVPALKGFVKIAGTVDVFEHLGDVLE